MKGVPDMYVSFRFRAKLAILGATTSAARVKNYIKFLVFKQRQNL